MIKQKPRTNIQLPPNLEEYYEEKSKSMCVSKASLIVIDLISAYEDKRELELIVRELKKRLEELK